MTRRQMLFAGFGLPGICLAQRPRTIKVTGRVNKPGEFELKDGMKVFDSLGLAGGFMDFADTRNIVIVRGAERRKFNYKDYVQGKRPEQNILLEGGDVVVVP
jgi:protein involved in polysaccharide export with SLBB domain